MNKILPAGLMALLASAVFVHGAVEASSKTGSTGSKGGSTKSPVVNYGPKTTTIATTKTNTNIVVNNNQGGKTPMVQTKNGPTQYSGNWGGWYGNGWGHGGSWGYRRHMPSWWGFGGCGQDVGPTQPGDGGPPATGDDDDDDDD
jgi:hypothetical protein